jgi:hypothetical protein
MKKLIIAITAVVAMASCKKENIVSPATMGTVNKNLVKAIYVYDNGTPDTDTYTYDGQGRISIFKEDARTTTFSYVSATSMVATERSNSDNSLLQTKECELNDKGYVTKMLFKNPAGTVTVTVEYTYNTDGYITSAKTSYSGGTISETVYSIDNGNVGSYKLYYNGVLNNTVAYTCDMTKLNKRPFGNGGYWNVPALFGKPLKNLVAEYKFYDAANTLTGQGQTIYDLDADGYPVKETTNYPLTGKQAVATFTYQ